MWLPTFTVVGLDRGEEDAAVEPQDLSLHVRRCSHRACVCLWEWYTFWMTQNFCMTWKLAYLSQKNARLTKDSPGMLLFSLSGVQHRNATWICPFTLFKFSSPQWFTRVASPSLNHIVQRMNNLCTVTFQESVHTCIQLLMQAVCLHKQPNFRGDFRKITAPLQWLEGKTAFPNRRGAAGSPPPSHCPQELITGRSSHLHG